MGGSKIKEGREKKKEGRHSRVRKNSIENINQHSKAGRMKALKQAGR